MSNLAKLEFVALDISGKNYLSWINDAEVHLEAMNLRETIKEGNEASLVDRAKAMIFLKRHIHEGLKCEYLTVKDPLALWGNLKERYDHQRTVILPKARHDWMHLRLQDFKSMADYNSALFRISSKLRLCGENITDADLLEKTFTIFHASNNHQSRPTRFALLHEVNAALAPSHEAYATSSHGDRRRGRGRGRARFADCHYNETFFPPLRGEKIVPEEHRELGWNISIMSHLDPRTTQSENEVQKIVHLQQIANQMPKAFTDIGKVTKSHIPEANTPARIDIPIRLTNVAANESSTARLK
ncbi:uncharacterized protein LOC117618094 [Prunus dulcis]|uniref:uncharacterized protein LOC117618094 n=1 Tax=Prunus dulcis TaxID=3755 RepID=UPI0014823C3C|nr:uncharacterized protein LOC117618094 [Prunus dulcis]